MDALPQHADLLTSLLHLPRHQRLQQTAAAVPNQPHAPARTQPHPKSTHERPLPHVTGPAGRIRPETLHLRRITNQLQAKMGLLDPAPRLRPLPSRLHFRSLQLLESLLNRSCLRHEQTERADLRHQTLLPQRRHHLGPRRPPTSLRPDPADSMDLHVPRKPA